MVWFSKSLLSLIFLLLIFHSLFSSSSSVRPQCRPETRTALINLNCSESLFNKSSDCCSWSGVECDSKTGHVTSLFTYECFLNGKIQSKSSLFSLRHLQRLTIPGSDLFKIEIGSDAFDALTQNLTSLKELTLIAINMSSVPLASLMNLSSSLTSLQISYCDFFGEFPENFFNFPNLVSLDLSVNNLGGHLPGICSSCTLPSKLTTLSLHSNSFTGPIPSWIFSLPNLEILALNNNLFTGEIGEFKTTSLSELSLDSNKLHGVIPRSMFQQTKLKHLILSSNNFTGTVELQELSDLKELINLYLSDNNLSVTNNCKNCTFESLLSWRMSSCNLTEFPNFLVSSKHLYNLDLSNNQIQGIVPKWLQEMERLGVLDLRSNFFFGPLSFAPPMLKYLLASKNQFSGEIPSSICNLKSVRLLDLAYNNLSGQIPPCIWDLYLLSALDLRSNKLDGKVPESLLGSFSVLQSLNLNGNQLEGQLPRSLVNCSDLEILDLGNNAFDDTFPYWLQSLPLLQVLVLRGNKFHGSIGNSDPGSFPFQSLRIMDLSHNDFAGDLPEKYFDNFKAMQMETGDRELSYMEDRSDHQGYYHDSVRITMKGFEFELERIQTIFTTIDFSCNNFSGQIPELLGKLKSLKGLNLSRNMLSGILPPSLGNLSNLEWLDLSSNDLVGKIPFELADIPWLSFFNVSHNHLEGPIPQGKQFNTFGNQSFEGNVNLCGFPLSKSCGGDPNPLESSLGQDEDDDEDSSNITNGFNWRIVMMGFASGLVIGISIGYMLLYSNGKLHWLSETILEEIEFRRAMRLKRRNDHADR